MCAEGRFVCTWQIRFEVCTITLEKNKACTAMHFVWNDTRKQLYSVHVTCFAHFRLSNYTRRDMSEDQANFSLWLAAPRASQTLQPKGPLTRQLASQIPHLPFWEAVLIGEIFYLSVSIRLFVHTFRPAKSEAESARPEDQPAKPEARPARPEAQLAGRPKNHIHGKSLLQPWHCPPSIPDYWLASFNLRGGALDWSLAARRKRAAH